MIQGNFDKQHVLFLCRITLQSCISITKEYLSKNLNTKQEGLKIQIMQKKGISPSGPFLLYF